MREKNRRDGVKIDFGIVFEILTLVFIVMARSYMSKYDEDCSKRFITFAMLPIGWLLIYDLITILFYVSNVLNFTFLGLYFVLQEGFIKDLTEKMIYEAIKIERILIIPLSKFSQFF